MKEEVEHITSVMDNAFNKEENFGIKIRRPDAVFIVRHEDPQQCYDEMKEDILRAVKETGDAIARKIDSDIIRSIAENKETTKEELKRKRNKQCIMRRIRK